MVAANNGLIGMSKYVALKLTSAVTRAADPDVKGSIWALP